MGAKMSAKILQQAREQIAEEDGGKPGPAALRGTLGGDDFDAGEAEADEVLQSGSHEDGQAFSEALEISGQDEADLARFMAPKGAARVSLADLVMGKIKEKETELASQASEAAPYSELNPRVVQLFTGVGKILSTYRTGKLPKALKIIPTLRNWDQVLYVTEPDTWTAAAMFQATRIFSSNLNDRMAQRFYNLCLLPRVRDDIAEYKKLNFHLYMAVKKALFKPGAWFRGLLLPICEAGDCSLREAVILSSVLTRTSIPVLQSSAALLKLAEYPYTGANSIFIRVLLDKKYALPFRVIDALVFHFHRFATDDREPPVLWHQCLLIFVQRYKEDITSEQKEALLELLRKHKHHTITADVRREIRLSRSRDNEVPMEQDPAIQFAAGAASGPLSMEV